MTVWIGEIPPYIAIYVCLYSTLKSTLYCKTHTSAYCSIPCSLSLQISKSSIPSNPQSPYSTQCIVAIVLALHAIWGYGSRQLLLVLVACSSRSPPNEFWGSATHSRSHFGRSTELGHWATLHGHHHLRGPHRSQRHWDAYSVHSVYSALVHRNHQVTRRDCSSHPLSDTSMAS
jgi:hypothetical protein